MAGRLYTKHFFRDFKQMWKHEVQVKLKFCTAEIEIDMYEGWNFNSGNYLFRTDTK